MKTPISPKVTAAGLAGVIASLLLAVVTLITPDLFDGLGKWSGLAYGLTIAVVTAVSGYLKNDPLRVTQTPDGTATDTTAVEASKQVSLSATAVNPPVSFAPTQARIDAAAVQLPDVLQPAPVVPAPTV